MLLLCTANEHNSPGNVKLSDLFLAQSQPNDDSLLGLSSIERIFRISFNKYKGTVGAKNPSIKTRILDQFAHNGPLRRPKRVTKSTVPYLDHTIYRVTYLQIYPCQNISYQRNQSSIFLITQWSTETSISLKLIVPAL